MEKCIEGGMFVLFLFVGMVGVIVLFMVVGVIV